MVGKRQVVNIKLGQGRMMLQMVTSPDQGIGAKVPPHDCDGGGLRLLQMFQHKAFAGAGIQQTGDTRLPNEGYDALMKFIQQGPLDWVWIKMFLTIAVSVHNEWAITRIRTRVVKSV